MTISSASQAEIEAAYATATRVSQGLQKLYQGQREDLSVAGRVAELDALVSDNVTAANAIAGVFSGVVDPAPNWADGLSAGANIDNFTDEGGVTTYPYDVAFDAAAASGFVNMYLGGLAGSIDVTLHGGFEMEFDLSYDGRSSVVDQQRLLVGFSTGSVPGSAPHSPTVDAANNCVFKFVNDTSDTENYSAFDVYAALPRAVSRTIKYTLDTVNSLARVYVDGSLVWVGTGEKLFTSGPIPCCVCECEDTTTVSITPRYARFLD